MTFPITGTSPIDPKEGITVGRKHGGLGIMWNKNLTTANPINYEAHWIQGLNITNNNKSILVLNVYFPYQCNANVDKYIECLGKLESILRGCDNEVIYIVGDFNANLVRDSNNSTSLFGNYLTQFTQDNQYIISDHTMLPLSSYTYTSHAWNTTTWIDHCVTTKAGHECINEIDILYNFVTSDHKPMRISVNYSNIKEKININTKTHIKYIGLVQIKINYMLIKY